MSPFIRAIPIPDRVREGYDEDHKPWDDRDGEKVAYARGYEDAVKDLLGTDVWFAFRCDLDGNPLPRLVVDRGDA